MIAVSEGIHQELIFLLISVALGEGLIILYDIFRIFRPGHPTRSHLDSHRRCLLLGGLRPVGLWHGISYQRWTGAGIFHWRDSFGNVVLQSFCQSFFCKISLPVFQENYGYFKKGIEKNSAGS